MCFWVLRRGISYSLRRRKHALRGELIIGRSAFAIVLQWLLDVIGCYWRFAMLSSCAIDRCWMDVTSENGAKLQKTLRLTPNNRLL